MKWSQIARLILPVLAATIPQMDKLKPIIEDGINAAEHIHGDTNNEAKKKLVEAAVAGVVATGKVDIPIGKAKSITDDVFDIIDSVKAANKKQEDTKTTKK